jgi:5-methylcytosine-specific restriction protein B
MDKRKFSWVNTHKQLVKYLETKENEQTELIDLLKSVGITPFNDKSTPDGHDIELNEIDPFTFFCYIYKYGSQKRLQFLQKISQKLSIEIPEDDNGLPSANAQKVWLFPYKYARTNNEIPRLWSFFRKVINDNLTNQDFQDILEIKSIGKTKLTEALFYIKPEKYLPINRPTKPYIKDVFQINSSFNSFSEYAELLNQIKQKSDIPFYEISYKAWKWNKERQDTNYWIFQGNPKVFDFKTALREEILTDWTVSSHKDKIKVGDKVIIWITGDNPGCYALAEIASEPHKKESFPDDHLWKTENKYPLKADIEISHNLVDEPILIDDIKDIKELKNLKVGFQGTNFSATKSEYDKMVELAEKSNQVKYWLFAPGENAYKWNEFYDNGIMAIGWDEIGNINKYNNKQSIKEALFEAYGGSGSKKNDVTAIDDFLNNISINDVVIVKKGLRHLIGYGIVTSNYIYDNSRNEYKHVRKVKWVKKGLWKVDFNLVLKTLTDITKYVSDDPNYKTYYERLMGIMQTQDIKTEKLFTDNSVNYHLNTIFYGPPGTGKTYNTVIRAAEIIENRKIDSYDEALEIFKANLHGQIEFITFHQNYSYEDFIQGLRPDVENNSELTFERKDGIFKVIADRANANLLMAENKKIAKKEFDVVFKEFIEPLQEEDINELEIKMNRTSYYITGITNKSIEFKKKSGSSAHTLSISTLKKMYYEGKNNIIVSGLQPYYDPLLNLLLQKGEQHKVDVKKKNYVIIIDEINRANISRVFGELITLIEPDKRSHGNIPMEAKLPSGDTFIVPSNLYIIGTMNTADKSIALLDIALRRRFEFESMYPLYEIDDHEIYDLEIFRKINQKIIQTKGHDFQIGHSYFMGENKNLTDRMNKKVIPLLLEYYMNDAKEVKDILKSAGLIIDEESWPIKITGKYD